MDVTLADEFDYNGIILRRADPDDCDQIINLVEIGKDDAYNRVYSYPRILKLIESAYMAITVLDREGNVVAFAAFEDFPQVSYTFQSDHLFNRECEACMTTNITTTGRSGSSRPSRLKSSQPSTPFGSPTSLLEEALATNSRSSPSRRSCRQSTPPCPTSSESYFWLVSTSFFIHIFSTKTQCF